MDKYLMDGSSRPSLWKRRLLIVLAGFVAVVWLLILPLPGPMARARHRMLTAGADAPANGAPPQQRTPQSYDHAAGIVSFNGTSGNWQMQVDSCISGQLHAFYGVSLTSEQQPNLGINVVLPEDGADHITAKTLDGMLIRIPKEQCSVWDVTVGGDGMVYNNIYELAGHARFDCTLQDSSAHVAGDVTLRKCSN